MPTLCVISKCWNRDVNNYQFCQLKNSFSSFKLPTNVHMYNTYIRIKMEVKFNGYYPDSYQPL